MLIGIMAPLAILFDKSASDTKHTQCFSQLSFRGVSLGSGRALVRNAFPEARPSELSSSVWSTAVHDLPWEMIAFEFAEDRVRFLELTGSLPQAEISSTISRIMKQIGMPTHDYESRDRARRMLVWRLANCSAQIEIMPLRNDREGSAIFLRITDREHDAMITREKMFGESMNTK